MAKIINGMEQKEKGGKKKRKKIPVGASAVKVSRRVDDKRDHTSDR